MSNERIKFTPKIVIDAVDNISRKGLDQPELAPSESAGTTRVMSNEDSVVADLVMEQPTEQQISAMTVRARRVPNLLELPEECLPLHGKKYRYVWLTKGKDLSVRLRTGGWVLCNRTNSPYIKATRFGLHGAVEQSGMLLAFLPEDIAKEMDMQPVRQSQDRVKHYTKGIVQNQDKSAPITFYKPEEKDEDRD